MVEALQAQIQELLSERRFDPTIAGDLENYVEKQVLSAALCLGCRIPSGRAVVQLCK